MGKAGEGSSGNGPVDRGTAARLLSVLLTTEDEELESYRRRFIGKDSELDLARLRAVQELLASVGATLRSTDEQAWAQLLTARDLLARDPEAQDQKGKASQGAAVAAAPDAPPPLAPVMPPPLAPVMPPPLAPVMLPPPAAEVMPTPPPAKVVPTPPAAKGEEKPRPPSLPFKAGRATPPRSALPDLPPLPEHAQRGTVGLDEDVLSPLARMRDAHSGATSAEGHSSVPGRERVAALPFRPTAAVAPPSGPAPTRGAAPPSSPAPTSGPAPTSRAAGAASSRQTIEHSPVEHDPGVVLPFKAGPVVEPSSALPDLPTLGPGTEHATVGLDDDVMSPLARLVLPFAKPAGAVPAPGAAPVGESREATEDSAPTVAMPRATASSPGGKPASKLPVRDPASKRPMSAPSWSRPSHDDDEHTELLAEPPPTSSQEEIPTTRLPAAAIAAAIAAASAPSAPSAPSARSAPELSVEQYAWLAVRCELDPASTPTLCRQHGIETDEALLALEQIWRARVAADAALRARFEQLVTHYRDWIARRGR